MAATSHVSYLSELVKLSKIKFSGHFWHIWIHSSFMLLVVSRLGNAGIEQVTMVMGILMIPIQRKRMVLETAKTRSSEHWEKQGGQTALGLNPAHPRGIRWVVTPLCSGSLTTYEPHENAFFVHNFWALMMDLNVILSSASSVLYFIALLLMCFLIFVNGTNKHFKKESMCKPFRAPVIGAHFKYKS